LDYRAGVTWNGYFRGQHTQYSTEDGDFDFYGDNRYSGGKLRSIVGLVERLCRHGHVVRRDALHRRRLALPPTRYRASWINSGVASTFQDGEVYNGTLPTFTSSVGSGTSTNFAWALHAGLAYTVNPNLSGAVLPVSQSRRSRVRECVLLQPGA
jgi:hypothetical protein